MQASELEALKIKFASWILNSSVQKLNEYVQTTLHGVWALGPLQHVARSAWAQPWVESSTETTSVAMRKRATTPGVGIFSSAACGGASGVIQRHQGQHLLRLGAVTHPVGPRRHRQAGDRHDVRLHFWRQGGPGCWTANGCSALQRQAHAGGVGFVMAQVHLKAHMARQLQHAAVLLEHVAHHACGAARAEVTDELA